MLPRPPQRTVFAKFVQPDILGEQGRLLFAVVNAFSRAGYAVSLCDNIAQESLGKYGRLARSLPGVNLVGETPPDTSHTMYVYDAADPTLRGHGWRKTVRVGFDIFAPWRFSRPVLMPFPLHPSHAGPGLESRLAALRAVPKTMRMFFSGDLKGYTQSRIRYPAPKLPRATVVDTIRARLGDRVLFVQTQDVLDRLLDTPCPNRCVIVDTGNLWVPERLWLDFLARTDFFLAPPGIVMPMCHNAVEAMAVGAIPVVSYPEWFQPRLGSPGECIEFGDEVDLVDKVNRVLDMAPEEIAPLRARAMAYYDTHLTSRRFVEEIESRSESHVDALIMMERYVAKNAKRLGRRSVLLKGADEAGRWSWLKSLAGL